MRKKAEVPQIWIYSRILDHYSPNVIMLYLRRVAAKSVVNRRYFTPRIGLSRIHYQMCGG